MPSSAVRSIGRLGHKSWPYLIILILTTQVVFTPPAPTVFRPTNHSTTLVEESFWVESCDLKRDFADYLLNSDLDPTCTECLAELSVKTFTPCSCLPRPYWEIFADLFPLPLCFGYGGPVYLVHNLVLALVKMLESSPIASPIRIANFYLAFVSVRELLRRQKLKGSLSN
jgi:hypothetical protein